MRKEIKEWVCTRLLCQAVKVHSNTRTPFQTIPTPTDRFHTVDVDLVRQQTPVCVLARGKSISPCTLNGAHTSFTVVTLKQPTSLTASTHHRGIPHSRLLSATRHS